LLANRLSVHGQLVTAEIKEDTGSREGVYYLGKRTSAKREDF
jgi:hypothetical protein